MELYFNKNNPIKYITINSYGDTIEDELSITLYTNDYNNIKDIIYNSDKTVMEIKLRDKESIIYNNYTKIIAFQSIVDEFGMDFITVVFKKSQPTIEELQARIAELEAKQAQYK